MWIWKRKNKIKHQNSCINTLLRLPSKKIKIKTLLKQLFPPNSLQNPSSAMEEEISSEFKKIGFSFHKEEEGEVLKKCEFCFFHIHPQSHSYFPNKEKKTVCNDHFGVVFLFRPHVLYKLQAQSLWFGFEMGSVLSQQVDSLFCYCLVVEKAEWSPEFEIIR